MNVAVLGASSTPNRYSDTPDFTANETIRSMNSTFKITILADNTAAARGMRGEHGLAFWMECGDTSLLFDTGQGLVLADNAQTAGIELSAVHAVVLSHGHYDHTGGLTCVLKKALGPVSVYAHPKSFMERFSHSGGTAHSIGMPEECRQALAPAGANVRQVNATRPVEVIPSVWTTGEIPRHHPQEAVSGAFSRTSDGMWPDIISDDQALFIETISGTVVILGCAHAGVINTLDYIVQLTGGRHLHAVIGGMHLGAADATRFEWTIARLGEFGLDLLVPLHCTGQVGFARLWAAFPSICVPAGAGSTFQFTTKRREA